jgi:hypothetical protein
MEGPKLYSHSPTPLKGGEVRESDLGGGAERLPVFDRERERDPFKRERMTPGTDGTNIVDT